MRLEPLTSLAPFRGLVGSDSARLRVTGALERVWGRVKPGAIVVEMRNRVGRGHVEERRRVPSHVLI